MTRSSSFRFAISLAILGAVGLPAWADRPDETEKPKATPPATVKVEKAPFQVAVQLKGSVQCEALLEVAVQLKAWSGPLVVQFAVEHGAHVKSGDLLATFESEKLDQLIRDARQERALAELGIRQLELDIPLLEKQAALDLSAATRSNGQAEDDLKRFLATDLPQAKRSMDFELKMANFFVDYAKEDLKQLEKMYKDKDLTEETEQLILKRYRFMLEMEAFQLQRSKIQVEQMLKVHLPRQERDAREAVEKAALALAKARDQQPLQLKQKQLALAKLVFEEAKATTKLADLEKDRAALTVRAPAEGTVYHGRLFRGQWVVPAGPQDNSLLRGSSVAPGHVFLTLALPGKRFLRADADEKELPGLAPGLEGTLAPTTAPLQRVAVKVTRVALVPLGGKFAVDVEPDAKIADALVPGTTGSLRFVTYRKPGALSVPASAVFEDVGADSHYVYRPGKTPEKRVVRIGHRSGGRVEIVSGLAERDEILAAKPKSEGDTP